MLLSPPGRWRSLPAHMESGQARVHSGVQPLAPLARPLTLSNHASLAPVPLAPSPPRGLPLLLPRAGETVAVGAVHRLARPHAQSARPRRPSVPDRRLASAQMPGQAGHYGGAVTVGSRQTLHSSPSRSFRSRFSVCQPCRFNPSQPPKGGAITPGLTQCFESPSVPGSAS